MTDDRIVAGLSRLAQAVEMLNGTLLVVAVLLAITIIAAALLSK